MTGTLPIRVMVQDAWDEVLLDLPAVTPLAEVKRRANQLLPGRMKRPRFSPVRRRRTAYFQYAACTASSQMLCRPLAGLHAASFAVTPRSAPRRLGPCQALRR